MIIIIIIIIIICEATLSRAMMIKMAVWNRSEITIPVGTKLSFGGQQARLIHSTIQFLNRSLKGKNLCGLLCSTRQAFPRLNSAGAEGEYRVSNCTMMARRNTLNRVAKSGECSKDPLTYKREVDVNTHEVFLEFFRDDFSSALAVSSSCVHIPKTPFDTSLVRIVYLGLRDVAS